MPRRVVPTALIAALALAAAVEVGTAAIEVPDNSGQPLRASPVEISKDRDGNRIEITERHHFHHEHLPIEATVHWLLLALASALFGTRRAQVALLASEQPLNESLAASERG